ncbi:MAG: tetratricopeptide repeat protein [Candidatus Solibacter sp.]
MKRKVVLAAFLLVLAGACAVSPEAKRSAYLAQGKSFLQKKDYARAVLEFKNAAAIKPAEAEAYYQLGVAYSGLEEYRAALSAFRRSADLNPKHAAAQLRLSQLLSMTDDPELWQDAKGRLTGLLQGISKSSDTDTLNALAFTELRLGNQAAASQILEQILVDAPGKLSSAVLLSQTRVQAKDYKGAEAVLVKACMDSPKSADIRRYLAEFYINAVKMPEAEVQLRQALEIDPQNAPVLMDLARLELTVGKKADAEQNFKKLLAYDGYQSIYGLFLFQEGRTDEALREFQRLVKERPADRAARTQLVVAYRSLNRPADAKKVLEQAIKANPQDADALLQRGEIYLSEAKYAESEADLNSVLRVMPSAAEVHYLLGKLYQASGKPLLYRQELFSALQINPGLLVVRLELARLLTSGRDARTALDLLAEAPRGQKNSLQVLIERNWALWATGDMIAMRQGIDQGLAQTRSPDLLVQDGLWKLRANNPQAARAALEEALKIDPADLRALQGLRQTYIAQKDSSKALQAVKDYAAKQPKSAAIQDFLGLLLLASGDRTEARKAFSMARELKPGFSNADLSLAQVDVAEGKLEDAHKRLQTLLSGDPGNLTALRWLGNIEVMRGNNQAAIDRFRKVVAADPNDAQASNNLAYLMVESGGDHDTALKLAQKAVDLNPSTPEFCDTLGWVLYRKGIYDSAIKYFSLASSNPQNAVWKYHLAMAYAKAGDKQRGRTALEAAFRVNANVPEAKVAKEMLDGMR